MSNNKTSGSYDSYMSKDVSQLLEQLKNTKKPDANKWQKNFYLSIIKLHDNEVEKIVDFYSIFKKNGIIKKEVINFMNKVVEKFITEKKILKIYYSKQSKYKFDKWIFVFILYRSSRRNVGDDA